MAADPVFIDTNVLVAAAVDLHPSHGVAAAYLGRIAAEGGAVCISGQVCREFLVALTRGPVEGRAFTVDEALSVLDKARSSFAVLDEDESSLFPVLESDLTGFDPGDAALQLTEPTRCGVGVVALVQAPDELVRELGALGCGQRERVGEEIPVLIRWHERRTPSAGGTRSPAGARRVPSGTLLHVEDANRAPTSMTKG